MAHITLAAANPPALVLQRLLQLRPQGLHLVLQGCAALCLRRARALCCCSLQHRQDRITAWIKLNLCKWCCCQTPSMLHFSAVCTRLQRLQWRAATFLWLAAVLIQVVDIHVYAGCVHGDMSAKLHRVLESQPTFHFLLLQ